jgi:hypothetical protein
LNSTREIRRKYVGNQDVVNQKQLLSEFLTVFTQSVTNESVAEFGSAGKVLSNTAPEVGLSASRWLATFD